MKNISVKILLAALSLIFVNCDHKSSFQDTDTRNTTDIHHILTDTLNSYLKNNYWYTTDVNGHIICRPFIYICFQHLDKKNFVSFAISPHIIIDTSFEVTYYESMHGEFLYCVLFDVKDSINARFINNYSFEPLEFCHNSYLKNPCVYDGRIFLRSYEITHKNVGDTLLLLSQPLTTWICDPPESFF